MEGLIFGTLFTDVVVFGSLLLYLLYRYSTSTFNYWKERGVPYIEPTPFFGNSRKTILLQMPLEVGLRKLYDQLSPHKFGGIYDMRQPMLMLRDPELLKQVMVKDFSHFQDRGFNYNDEIEPLSPNLVNVGGERWKNLRSKLSPAFSSGKLKQMFPLIVECTEELKNYLNTTIEKEGNIHECRKMVSKFSTDVVGSCAFGINCNCMSDNNSEFTRIVYRFVAPSYEFAIRRIIRFFIPKVADILKMKDIPQEVTNFFLKLTKETIEYREKNDIIRNDFMELLKQLKNKGCIHGEPDGDEKDHANNFPYLEKQPLPLQTTPKEKADKVFDNKLLSAQAFSFFIAGFETTAAAITFCLYELAVNIDVQTKLRADILSMLDETDGKIAYENIISLVYLDKVISETLRKYPTAGHTLRRVTKSYTIPDTNVHLDVGQFVLITIYGLHHDPVHYPDPEKFDPERFSKEAIAKRHPYAYMPFGTGPRICIGMRFALLEIKVAIAMLLSNFQFDVCSKTKIPLELDTRTLFMAVKNGAWLKISKLESTT